METKCELSVEWILIIQVAFCILCVVQCNEICEIHATVIRRVENEGFHR
jgi:hypothetical protein